MNKPASPSDNVFQFPLTKKDRRRAEDKWSPQVIKLGYTPLPSLLLKAQAKLKLKPVPLNVLLQVIEHWWDADKDPFPSKETIARRMKLSPRQIQRVLTKLEKDGFIKRVPRYSGRGQQTSNAYSLDGTVRKLKALEPEFRKAKEQNRNRSRKVESGGAA